MDSMASVSSIYYEITSNLRGADSREVNDLACELKGQRLNLKVSKECE